MVKGDLMDTIRNFHEAFLDLGSNVSFLSLILKNEHANKVSDFRSISLGAMFTKFYPNSLLVD